MNFFILQEVVIQRKKEEFEADSWISSCNTT